MKESKRKPRKQRWIHELLNKTNLIFKIIEIHIVFMDWKTLPGKNVIPPTFFFFLQI